jgi:hypothetical protein
MDCTEWAVFDTEVEAREYLYETWNYCPACLQSLEWAACKCIQEEVDSVWHDAVASRLNDMPVAEIMALPGVYEAVSERFNNEIIEELSEKVIEQWRESVTRSS